MKPLKDLFAKNVNMFCFNQLIALVSVSVSWMLWSSVCLTHVSCETIVSSSLTRRRNTPRRRPSSWTVGFFLFFCYSLIKFKTFTPSLILVYFFSHTSFFSGAVRPLGRDRRRHGCKSSTVLQYFQRSGALLQQLQVKTISPPFLMRQHQQKLSHSTWGVRTVLPNNPGNAPQHSFHVIFLNKFINTFWVWHITVKVKGLFLEGRPITCGRVSDSFQWSYGVINFLKCYFQSCVP